MIRIQPNNSFIKSVIVLSIAGLLMGNKGCEQPPQGRDLRRRVQMGAVETKIPAVTLPNATSFDFKFVANAQMYDVLKKTQSFSTATTSDETVFNLDQMSDEDKADFYQCVSEPETQFSGKMSAKVWTQESPCMIHMPLARINVNILDFSLTDKFGLKVGLAQMGGLSANFQFASSELSMNFIAMDPLIRKRAIATSSKISKQTEVNVGLSFFVDSLELGPSFYFRSPLSKVVQKGLEEGITQLKQDWDKVHPWYGMVLKNCDSHVYINAGDLSDSGLMENDIMKIYNVEYDWAGQACDSQLRSTIVAGDAKPIAYARVVRVGDTISKLEIIKDDPNYPRKDAKIYPGARVYIEKLYDANAPK